MLRAVPLASLPVRNIRNIPNVAASVVDPILQAAAGPSAGDVVKTGGDERLERLLALAETVCPVEDEGFAAIVDEAVGAASLKVRNHGTVDVKVGDG